MLLSYNSEKTLSKAPESELLPPSTATNRTILVHSCHITQVFTFVYIWNSVLPCRCTSPHISKQQIQEITTPQKSPQPAYDSSIGIMMECCLLQCMHTCTMLQNTCNTESLLGGKVSQICLSTVVPRCSARKAIAWSGMAGSPADRKSPIGDYGANSGYISMQESRTDWQLEHRMSLECIL